MTPEDSDNAPTFALSALADVQRRLPVEELYRLGFEAESADLFDDAAAFFDEVHRRQPRNPFAMMDLARIYFKLFERESAKALLREAGRWIGPDAEAWYQIGLIYQDARVDEEAERCFLLARKHAGGNLLFSAALVAFYESRGDVSKAKATLERVARKSSGNGLIMALKGMVLLRSGEDFVAETVLRESLAKLPVDHPYQISVRYSLARIMAKDGRELASLDVLREAKTLQEASPEAQRNRAIGQAVAQFRSDAFAAIDTVDIRTEWKAEATPDSPLVFLLGYPRSGTTLLEQVVETHPGVQGFEETSAFLQAFRRLFERPLQPGDKPWEIINAKDPAARHRARAWYGEFLRRLGAASGGSRLLLDKNPGLTGHLQFLSRLFPEAKILFIMRDPRDICLSAFQTQVDITPFSVNWLRWNDTVRHCASILNYWDNLRDRIPNPWLEVRYEDLIDNLPETGRRVMEFLGLDWLPAQEDFITHTRAKPVYSPTLYDVRRSLNREAVGKWRRFGMDYSDGGQDFAGLLERHGYLVD